MTKFLSNYIEVYNKNKLNSKTMEPDLMFRFSCFNCLEKDNCWASKEKRDHCKVKQAISAAPVFDPYIQLDQPGTTKFFMDPEDYDSLSEMEKKLFVIKNTYTK